MRSHELFDIIPKSQLEDIMSQERCELDKEFMGFTDVYKALASIIPTHFTVIDFGCYLAAQCYYFANHKRYIGVDVCKLERFRTHNTTHYYTTIQEYICHNQEQQLETTFAICSYVPDVNAIEFVRISYPNLFVFYPSSNKEKDPCLKQTSRHHF